jgi:ElaB/YqjD/DUF883 family membrane-anchored ribosome-binding protein
MNTNGETESNHTPNESATRPGGRAERPRVDFAWRAKDFAQRATAAARGLPSRVDGQIKRNPYAALGVVGVVGAGVGIVLSSRILRAVLTATATAAALELMRALIRGDASRVRTS